MNHRTELEKANEKLRVAESKLSLFASNARDLLYRYRLHPERGFDYVSPSAFALTGFTPEEHYSDPDLGYKLVHPDDRVKLEKLTEGSEVFSNPLQLRWVKKDGSIVWTEQVNVPVVDDKGTLLAIEGIARDITERKLAELSLLESEKKYRELFENMNSGFVLFEVVQNEQGIPVDLIIKAANIGFEKTTGLNLKDAVGQYLSEVIPGIEKDEADWIGTYSKVALTGESIQFEQGSELLGYYYSISAFRAATNQCAVTFVDITERKKAEELLQEKLEEIEVQNEEYKQLNEELLKTQKEFEISSKNFENIFTNSPIGIFVIDIDNEKNYIINSSNPVHEKLLGIKNEKVKGQPLVILTELFSNEVYVYVKNLYDKIVKTKETINFKENLIINNIPVQVNTTIKPLIDENGKVYRIIGTNIDITELKQTEKELIAAKEKAEESEERFDLAMKASNDGLFDWNLETNEIYYSPAWKKMLGYEDDELPNDFSVWENTTDPGDVKKSWELQQKLINKEVDRFVLEFKMKHKDGHWVDILSRAEAIFNDSGKAVRIVGTHTDITEHKLAEEKIRENSSLIRIAAEKAKLGGWNVILNENRSYWSDEVAAIHEMPPGYSPLVEDGINFYAPEWHERITKVFTDCAERGIPYDEEMEIITSTGRRVWVRTIGEAARDENGQIFKVQGAFQDISEKKMAEAKSREKDLQFRKLSANVPDLLFQFTRKPDGTYCVPVASEGIRNIFGCSPEDVVDDFTPIANVIYPDDAERVIADIENSAKHLAYFTCEFRVQIPGRPVQWILSRSTPEKLPDGSITWYGFNADITQRKGFEDALRESEGKFRKIYEEGPFGVSLVSSEYKFMIANRTFCDITGYSESELKELTFRDITFADDKDLGIESVKKLVKGEIPVFKLEKRYVRKDGQVIWVAVMVTAHFDKNGNFLYNLAIIEDITGRKQAEEKIQTLNDRLQLLVEAIQELSISTSLENIMKTVRKSARKLVNAEGSTFILRDGDSCYYADEDAVSPLWKGQRFPLTNCISGWAMLNKQPVIIEDIYADDRIPIEAYKSTFVRSLAIAPIRLNDPLGAIGAYWGSNYFPSEIEIKLLNTLADAAAKAVENVQLIEGLEQKISERTSQLQASNKELEAFSYSVSHDLRAPLRHINGFVDLLNRRYSDELPDKARHYLEAVSGASQQMGTLIDELLQYSRTGRQEVRKTELDMNLLVKEVLQNLKSDTEGRKITWDIQELPKVFGDYILLKQVWINLFDNAVKYTRNQKNAKISVGFSEEAKEFVFCVCDNGVGFDMKYAHKLFGVFQRLHSQSEFEGTGIGLANVQRIINKHMGRAWAEAETGKGAKFYFNLPKYLEE